MKQNLIELLNVAGTPTICYEVDSVDNITRLYGPLLLRISDRGLIDFHENLNNEGQGSDKNRFVIAKNQQEKNTLLKVQPIRCYLRDHEMNSKVVQINPYQSVRWLKSLIENQRHTPIKLVINETQLTDETQSLLKYIYQDCIIHIIECRESVSIIPILYTKQPGIQFKTFKLQNVPTQNSIDWLTHEISQLTGVPYEFLYLIYGGKILQKERKIIDYNILTNGVVYAADSRRYLKKVSKAQHEKRVSQVKRTKQVNRKVSQIARQQMQRRKSADKLQRKKVTNNREETATQIVARQGEDIQYFKSQSMDVQNEQNQQEQILRNLYQNNSNSNANPISPPNSPIYLFNTLGTLNRANSQLKQGRVVTTQTEVYQDAYGYTHQHSKQKTIFKDGKTKIVDLDVVQDQQGNVVKIQEDTINIKKDSITGNIIKTETEVIEDSENSKTIINRRQVRDGQDNVIKQQTLLFKTGEGIKKQRGITKEGDNVVEVTTQILQNQEGDPYKIETDIMQTNQDKEGNTIQRSKDIKQQDGVTQVIQKKIIRDKQGNIIQSKTDIIEITQDDQGNIYKHERKLTDKQDKKIVIQRDIVTDKHGDLLSRQTNMKIIRGDSKDNTVIQQTDIAENVDGSTVVIEKSVIRNSEGVTIKSDSSMYEIKNQQQQKRSKKHVEVHEQVDQQGTLYKYEKNQLLDEQNRKVIFETDTIIDSSGQVIMKEKNTTVIEQDENKNKIVRQTETIEQTAGGRHPESSSQGGQQDVVVKKTILTQTETITDAQGNLISSEKNTRRIEKDQNKNTLIFQKNQTVDGQGAQPVVVESQLTVNPQGVIIHSLGRDQQGKIYEHQRVQVAEDGITKVTQIDTIIDSEGKVIARQANTKTYEQNEESKSKIISQSQIIEKDGSDPIFLQKKYQINSSGDVIRSSQIDQEGNVYQRNVEQVDEDNKLTVIETSTVTNPQGQIISKQVHKTTVTEDQQRNLIVHQTDIIQKQPFEQLQGSNISEGSHHRNKKIVIQKQTVTDAQGKVIARETDTIVTQLDQNQNVVTKETDVIQQIKYNIEDRGEIQIERSVNKTSIIQKQTVRNAQGQVLKDETNIKIIDSGVDKNTQVYESNVIDQKDADKLQVVQNTTVINPKGIVVKQQGKDQQGNIYQYQRNQQKQQNKKTIVQTDIIINPQGQVVTKQVHTKIFEEDDQNNIVIRDINQINQGEKVTVTETDTFLDAYGTQIGKETNVRYIEQNNRNNTVIREKQTFQPMYGQPYQKQRIVQMDQDGIILKSTSINEDGQIHHHERKQQQQQHKRTVIITDTYTNSQGVIVTKQTNTRVIQQDQNNNVLIKQTDLLEQKPNSQGQYIKKVIMQKQTAKDSEGRIIGQQTNTKFIQQDHKKNQYIKQTDVIEQIAYKQRPVQDGEDNLSPEKINKTSVIEKQILINSKGEVLVNEMNMRVFEKDANQNTVIFETNQIDQKYSDNKITTENETVLDEFGNVIKSQKRDEQGNVYKYEKQQIEDQGKRVIIKTDIVTDPQGHLLSKQVKTTTIERDQNQNTSIHMNDVIQQSNLEDGVEKKTKIIVQKEILRDPQGHLLGKQTTTKTIEEDQNNNTVLHETNIIQQVSHQGARNMTSVIQKQIVTSPEGQILTNQTNIKVIEQDPDRNTVIFQNKVVDDKELDNKIEVQRNVVVNPQGVVIKSSDRDYDGNLYQFERNQVQGRNRRIIVQTDTIKDPQGDVLVKQTNTRVFKQGSDEKLTVRQTDVVEQRGGNITAVQKIVQMDPQGIIVSSYQREEDGTVHEYERRQKDYHDKKAIVQTETVTNPEGNVTVKQINRTILGQDGQNYAFVQSAGPRIPQSLARGGELLGQHHQNRKITIQTEIVRDSQGEIIQQQTTTKTVEKDEAQNTIIHETNLIEQDGVVVEIQNNIIIGPQGEIIKSQCKVNEIDNSNDNQVKQTEVYHDQPQVLQVEGQREPLINGGTQITVDELGNTHTRQKQLLQKQGKTTFVDRDTVQDPRGKLIRIQTDVVQIEGDNQGNMHKHKSEILEQEGKVTMIQTDEIMDPDGVIIRKQKDTIQIQNALDGSVHKHEKDVIQQYGQTRIIQKDIIQDSEGNVIKSKTLVTKVEDNHQKTEVHQTQQLIEKVQDGMQGMDEQITQNIEVIQDSDGNVMRRQQQVRQHEDGQRVVIQKYTIQNSQGDLLRQQTQVVQVREGQSQIRRHFVDYEQQDNKVLILQVASKQNPDGSIIRSQKQTVQIQQNQDGTIQKRQMDITYEDGKKTIHVKNVLQDQQGRIISKTSDVIEVLPGENQAIQDEYIQNGEGSGLVENIERPSVERKQNIDEQGNTHIIQVQTRNRNGHQIQIQRQYIQDPEGNIIKTETGIIDVQRRMDGSTKMTAVDIRQEGDLVTVVQNDSLQDQQGKQIRAQSGTMQVHQIGGGIKKRQQQNIIQQGGIKLRVEKQTYQDVQGNIIQQKVNTTELIDKYDQQGNKIVSTEGFKRKQQKKHLDQDGNTHYYQRQIIDNENGKTTVIETQVVRNQENQMVENSTDLIQMTEQLDGSIHRHEVNIIQKPGKLTMAETNTIQNVDGQRLKGKVQSIVVTTGQNGQKTKKQTTITMKDNLKTITQKHIVQDADGNVISTETRRKRIFIDQNGVETGRDLQTYQANQIQILGEPSTIEKQVYVDVQGVVHATQRLTTYKQQQENRIVETTTVKVTEQLDGSINQQMSVTKITKNKDGEIQVITTPVQIPLNLIQPQYTQVDSIIKGGAQQGQQIVEKQSGIQREEVLDESGNRHTYEKQVIDMGQRRSTIKSSQLVEDSSGHLVTINTNVVDTQVLDDGKLVKHTTQVISGEKVTTTQTYTIQNPDGSIHSQKTRTVQVTEDQGLIKTNRTDVIKQGGTIKVDKYETLEDEDGNLLDSSYNKLQIKDTQQAVREQAHRVARAQIQGEVTGIVTEYQQDSLGNRHVIQRQTIEDHGKKIKVDSVIVENTDGQILKVQTDIVSEQILQDGKIQKHSAVITQQGGDVCVVEFTEVKQDDSNLENLQRMSGSRGEQNRLNDLLGLDESQQASKKEVEQDVTTKQRNYDLLGQYGSANQSQLLIQSYNPNYTNQPADLLGFSGQNSSNSQNYQMKKTEANPRTVQFQNNLLQASFQVKQPGIIQGQSSEISSSGNVQSISKKLIQQSASQKKLSQLPIFSKKQLQQIPKQYDIIAYNSKGDRARLRIRYDEIIDEVAEKLGNLLGIQKNSIKFMKDGEELQQYEMVSDLGILPEFQLQYLEK